ncbi:Thiopurine S-methyltransferase-domain-containing protein [Pavlovales sp. CCMP2436]|nr:Thiopurine S-methyltransferase-domain-containing protein [Pavlovales sp. CCMP2436]
MKMLGLLRRSVVRPRHVAILASLGAGGSAWCYYQPDASEPERIERWADKWQAMDIKFHKRDVHPALAKHYDILFPDGAVKRVIVPLCGKTVDLPFLARKGHEVVGVEGVPLAAEQFAKEQPTLRMAKCAPPSKPAPAASAPAAAAEAAEAADADFFPAEAFAGPREGFVFTTRKGQLGYHRDVPPTVGPRPAAAKLSAAERGEALLAERGEWVSEGGTPLPRPDRRPQSGTVWLSVRDWFCASRAALGSFGVAWDRGGLVAVPPAMRVQYVRTINALLEPRGRILLSCFDYDQAKAPGPPFALPVEEVVTLFPNYKVQVLERKDVSAEFRQRVGTPWENIGKMDELAILLVKKRTWWRRMFWPFGGE